MARSRSDDDLFGVRTEEPLPAAEMDWATLRKGVSRNWLAGALKMDVQTVKKRLGGVKPIKKGNNNQDLYDFAEAMSYLVKPRIDVAEYIRGMNPRDLPGALKKEFWQAENQRLSYMERAGELWHTRDVLKVFADVAQLIRTTVQVWADDMERTGQLDREQYAMLRDKVDSLRDEVHKSLVDMPRRQKTESVLADGLEDADDGTANV